MHSSANSTSPLENFFLATVFFVSTATFLLSPMNARGANPEVGSTPDPVEEKVKALRDKASSTPEMVEAETDGMKLWDQELNRVYGELLEKLPKEDRAVLKESQQDWIKFRDRNLRLIQLAYGNAEGSIYQVYAARAALDVVRDRVLDLRGYLDVVETAWPSTKNEQ